MKPEDIIILIAAYFGVLLIISWFTSRKNTEQTFYNGDHKSPWYIVAFGLIGTSLSAVSLVSVTGDVQNAHFSYMQIVAGYVVGYIIISYILLPLYYKHNLTSIYNYLSIRFGNGTRKTGAFYFILSRMLGASARVYLAVVVMEGLVISKLGFDVPFEATVAIILFLIFLYTFQSGIKTIIWTDTLQTVLLLAAIGFAIVELNDMLGNSIGENIKLITNNNFTEVFTTGTSGFIKNFLAGLFICVTMTGLDQGMMQRSLSCPSLKDAQKNIMSFAVVVFIVNLLFVYIGALLAQHVLSTGLHFDKTDSIFPYIAATSFAPVAMGLFVLGMIAATFSSADDAMAALTTSLALDIFGIKGETKRDGVLRKIIHLGVAFGMFLLIVLVFKGSADSVIGMVLKIGSITYGPLLGMFAFGMISKKKLADSYIPWIAVISPLLVMGICVYIHSLNNIDFKVESLSSLTQIWRMVFSVVSNEIIVYIAATCYFMMWFFSEGKYKEKAHEEVSLALD